MTMEPHLKQILEAVLMSSPEPLSLDSILAVFEEWERPTREQIKQALDSLKQDSLSRGVELRHLASGYCFQTKSQFAPWIARLLDEKPIKYSNALFEILAIIAYKQPVTRAEIEDTRGVTVSSSILKTLLEREWISIAGYKDVPGKPAVYRTTNLFLDYFNLASLNELPVMSSRAS